MTKTQEEGLAGSRSEEVRFDWGGLELAGSLRLPSGPGPHPAVVMAQGSGPADRNSDGFFEPILQAFTNRGIATFAFDKPGCGQSTGDWRHYALQARAEQMVAAIETVCNHRSIASERVGVWGHSQGGWIVQQLAGQLHPLAFAIASSAPSINVRHQILYDCEHSIRNQGHGQDAVRDALTLTRSLIEAAEKDADFVTISEQLLDQAAPHSWFSDFPTIDDEGDWQHFRLLVGEPHEPLADVKRVTCPFLAVYGGLDTLLPPWRGAEESGEALKASQSHDVTVVVFPQGDHRIQDAGTKQFVDGYLSLLSGWTANRVN